MFFGLDRMLYICKEKPGTSKYINDLLTAEGFRLAESPIKKQNRP